MLIPWPNRLQDGRYEFEGRTHQLPLTEPEHSNAIHGLVRWVAWQAREHEPHRVVLGHALHAQPGYPFSLELEIEYELSTSGLTVRTTATNIGAAACPYGSGAHPYLTLGTETVDDVALRVPARTALRSDDRGIPVGTARGRWHRARLPRGSSDRPDEARQRLHRPRARRCGHRPRRTDGRRGPRRPTLWVDESYPYVMVFTGDIPSVERRGLAVEPMTCPPNAFRSGAGLIQLEPGASFTSTWGIVAQGFSPG